MSTWRSTSEDVTVLSCPDGPLLLRGEGIVVQQDDGTEVAARRRTVALCRCGRSRIAPWCDGTHRLRTRRTGASDGQEPRGRRAQGLPD